MNSNCFLMEFSAQLKPKLLSKPFYKYVHFNLINGVRNDIYFTKPKKKNENEKCSIGTLPLKSNLILAEAFGHIDRMRKLALMR